MADTRKKLRRATIIYWMMLIYIVAALIWWLISLERQNDQMRMFKVHQLDATLDSTISPALYKNQLAAIDDLYRRSSTKHIGEGIVFLVLILIGAAFVYRSVRRQFRLQLQQQNFMMAVTHELKTPIAVARLNLETLQRHQLDEPRRQKLIRMTLEETARLNSLTNNILVSSQLEGGRYTWSREELDLSDLLRDCMNAFRNRFPDRQLTDDIMPDMDVKGDPLLLELLINNLVENALKYSPKDKPVHASLYPDGKLVKLEITDEGPGVPDEEKKNIFEKFYRIGNEETRKTQGTGLGLYLCSKIARDHNADISVTNHTPTGSKFAVTFQLA
ncbi:sensor histidine kinase [Terrimonas ferruginea]|uniref:sensor histidine kinase n=1 Tax=Terrimonas ferruginea TaxID=249 RepID=UPI0003FD2E0A|nr:ATP-binding protein [Terrimonas ferruginea]